MNGFTIHFILVIRAGAGASSNDRWMLREVAIPFAPFNGLQINDGDFAITIKDLIWDVKEQRIESWHFDDRRYREARGMSSAEYDESKLTPMQTIIEGYEEQGWTLKP